MNTDPQTPHTGEIDAETGTETTGHEWDGIKELNTPLPRWWLIVFYASIVWAFGYWIFMPSWPGINGHLRGIRNHSERVNVETAVAEMQEDRAALGAKLLATSTLDEIENDPDLLQFTMAAGRSAFGDNCATCHGAGGQGYPGYPNLNDDVWLWGGSLSDIRQTITHGIRAGSDETRFSAMPAFGRDEILDAGQINDVTSYVQHLAGEDIDNATLARASTIYSTQCAVCHGADGTGMRVFGAPNLTDTEALYGHSRDAIKTQIIGGRNGVMPHWGERLDATTIASLAIYVHTLGGGEPSPSAHVGDPASNSD